MSSAGQTRIKIAVALMVALAVFLAVWGLRGAGLLQDLELTARDQTLRWGSDPAAAARPEHLFVVAATDADLARFGHPIPDAVLAEAIRRIGSAACCIGLDIYRGTPVPPGSDELSAALDAVPATVGVVKLARDGRIEAATHPTLADRGGYGVAFVPLDPDGTVRRGLLYLGAGGRTWPGFALQASLAYLAGQGVGPQPAAPGSPLLRLGAAVFPRLTGSFGGYADVDAGGYQFLMDYRIPTGRIARASLSDVIDGAVAPEALHGRLVLLGTDSEVVKDNFFTPLTPGGEGQVAGLPTRGVFVHAHAADQIIRAALGEHPVARAWSDGSETAAIAGASATGALVGLLFTPLLAPVALALGALLIGGVAYQGAAAGLWLPAVPIGLAWVAAGALAAVSLAALERRWRQQIAALFAGQLSDRLADMIWRERDSFLAGGRPKPQRLPVTVLFVDLKGSTSVSEAMPPDAFMAWVGTFLDRMAEIAVDHDAVIEKFTGDGLMAVFGAPVPRATPDEVAADAAVAADCALDMRRAVAMLNAPAATDTGSDRPPVVSRVGIASGEVVGGTVGSARRMQYTVVGDAANTAARLEGLDAERVPFLPEEAGMRILCEAACARLLEAAEPGYDLRFVGAVPLKGLSRDTRVFRVAGRVDAANRLAAAGD